MTQENKKERSSGMTPKQRDELIDAYAWRVVDDMDFKTLYRWCAEIIAHGLETESDDYVIEQVKEYYPDLLNEQKSERN